MKFHASHLQKSVGSQPTMTSIASIERITPTRLSSLLRAGGDEVASIAVVDVRDEGV